MQHLTARPIKLLSTLLLPLILILPLGGCHSPIRLEARTFAVTMSLDAVDSGSLRIGVQIFSGTERLNESSGGIQSQANQQEDQQGGAEPNAYLTFSATGNDFFQALLLLQATIPRKLDFSHLRQVVVSETLARSDAFYPLLEQVESTLDMRTTAYLLVTPVEALTFLAYQRAHLGARLTEYLDSVLLNSRLMGFSPIMSVSDVVRNMHSDRIDSAVTYASVNTFESAQPLVRSSALDALPGHLPRQGITQVEYLGAAVFNNRYMVGVNTGKTAQLAYALHGLLVDGHYAADGVYYTLSQQRGPNRTVVFDQNNQPSLIAELWLNAAPMQPDTAAPPGKLFAALEKDLKDTILLFQSLSSDPLGFGRDAIRHFPTNQAWEAYDWRAQYSQAEVQIKLHLTELTT